MSLEGNEAGTYFRGSSRIVDGRAEIAVPEDFRHVTEAEGLTVQLTGTGRGILWVEAKDLETIQVAGDRDIAFDYFVHGVRRGYADFETVHANRVYVPHTRNVPWNQVPEPARALLVENGTLNADGTPNEHTAARMGWTLHDRAELDESRPVPQPQIVGTLGSND